MKFISITRNNFPLWRQFREAIYDTLEDEYHSREMEILLKSDAWHCWFVTDEHNEKIGLVELSLRNIVDGCLSTPVVYLEGLYLKPEYRNKGLGTQLIKKLRNWCSDQGYSELATDTQITNIKAQQFYEKLGFEEVDRVVEYRIDIVKI